MISCISCENVHEFGSAFQSQFRLRYGGFVEPCPPVEQERAAFGLGSLGDDVFSRCDGLCYFYNVTLRRCVFDHYDGVRAWRDRGAGHDGICLAAIQRGCGLNGAGFDLSDYFELGRKLRQIGGVDRIAVARGSREGRDVAVGGDGLGQHSPGSLEQSYSLVGARN